LRLLDRVVSGGLNNSGELFTAKQLEPTWF
jgi:hypothetical protein